MADALIGGVTTNILHQGGPTRTFEELDVFQVVGIDGHGVQRRGKRGRPYVMFLKHFGTAGAVLNWVLSIEQLQGAVITYVDDRGESSGNVLVQEVSQPRYRPAIGEGGASAELRMVVRPVG